MHNAQKDEYPLVTVVTVTFNSSVYVRDAIESVLASSYKNFELIIADDASTDDTWSIIKEYTDPRIVAYRNDKNLGEYPNRNKAIHLARGEYLIFIDGDDMIYPHGLELMINNVLRNSPCGMLLMCPYLNWVFFPIIVSPRNFYLSNYFAKSFNNIAFANTLFSTEILKQEELLPIDYRCGDTYIRLRIAAKHDTLIIQDQLTWWRETFGQASKQVSQNPLSIFENYMLHKRVLQEIDNPLSPIERSQALTNEIYTIKFVLLSYLKKADLRNVFIMLKELFKRNLFHSVLYSKKTYINPFEQYSPDFPYKMDLNWD
jgi:glycosyltransferase involved in cell wall biosynthesis